MHIDEADFLTLLHADLYFITVLKVVREHMPNAYVAAGFIRNRVWDHFYNQEGVYPDLDIDVVYYDSENIAPETDCDLEEILQTALKAPWQVRNQARMHTFGGYQQFDNSKHALMHWPETATAIGVRLTDSGDFDFIAPFGFDDLFNHVLRITRFMKAQNSTSFHDRLKDKQWLKRWPNLIIFDG